MLLEKYSAILNIIIKNRNQLNRSVRILSCPARIQHLAQLLETAQANTVIKTYAKKMKHCTTRVLVEQLLMQLYHAQVDVKMENAFLLDEIITRLLNDSMR